jgi:hypothetical protein
MSSNRPHVGRRRIAVVASTAVVLVGAVSAFFAVPALAETPAEVAARTSPVVAGTPCTSVASACVDVDKKKAWLIKDGKIFRGPVPIATGGNGEATPTGDVFRVYRLDKDHKTQEFKDAKGNPEPMPYSVFFEDGGIAFHAGDPHKASAGCVHLNLADAIAFFNFLKVGDHVQVKDGPVSSDDVKPSASSDNNNGDNNDDKGSDGSSDDSGSHHHHDDGDNSDDGDDGDN